MADYSTPVPTGGTFVSGVYSGSDPYVNSLATATLTDYVSKKSFDNISKKLFLLSWLRQKAKYNSDGGSRITVPILVALNDTVKAMGKWDEFSRTVTDHGHQAYYDKKIVGGTINVSTIDLQQNAGTPKMVDLLVDATASAELSMADFVGQALVGGAAASSATGIDGLHHFFRFDNNNTVGGIDKSANTYWQHKVAAIADFSDEMDAGGPTITSVLRQCSEGTSRPDLLLCSPATFDRFKAEAFQKQSLTTVNSKMANLGFQVIMWEGIEVSYDNYLVPSTDTDGYHGSTADVGVIFALNSDTVKLAVQKGFDFKVMGPMRELENQLVTSAKMVFNGCLTCNSMRSNGIIAIDAW